MATATFNGPHQGMTFMGASFRQGEERPVPDEIAAALAGHPWFSVSGVETLTADPEPRRRGRPRKVAE